MLRCAIQCITGYMQSAEDARQLYMYNRTCTQYNYIVQAHSAGTDESRHQEDKGWQVSMEEAEEHEQHSEGQVGVGRGALHVYDGGGGRSCRLLAHNHHILGTQVHTCYDFEYMFVWWPIPLECVYATPVLYIIIVMTTLVQLSLPCIP